MKKLKLQMQVSLDGFALDSDGKTDWTIWNWGPKWTWDEQLRKRHVDLTTSSECILLSRKMAEEGFVDHWATVAENPKDPQSAFAKPITDMKKIVFSKTLTKSSWPNTEIAKGDLVSAVNELKENAEKDLLAYGGPTFASSLLEANLLDEVILFMNPIALGSGKSMFKDITKSSALKFKTAVPYECGVAVLKYGRASAI